jgi:hypothetical protein
MLHTFSKVSAMVHVLYRGTIEGTFENLCLANPRRYAARISVNVKRVGNGTSAYIYMVWQKRPLYMENQAYLYGKKGLFVWQKRPLDMANGPIYMTNEAYLYGK